MNRISSEIGRCPYWKGALAVLLSFLIAFPDLVPNVHGQSRRELAERSPGPKAAKKSAPKKSKPAKKSPAEVQPDDDASGALSDPDEPPPPIEYESVKLADGTELQIEIW